MKKEIKAWAILQKKNGYEYKAGELHEVGFNRRVLAMNRNTKYVKVIPCIVTYEY